MSRLDFIWRIKFQNEKHQVETVSTISRLLLENILPKHVAQIIIKQNMSQVSEWNDENSFPTTFFLVQISIKTKPNEKDLYHESYDNVVVMFASIPNFKEFSVQSDTKTDGLESLRLLNEIIAEFDKVFCFLFFIGEIRRE